MREISNRNSKAFKNNYEAIKREMGLQILKIKYYKKLADNKSR